MTIALLCAFGLWAGGAAAHGALAIGVPKSVTDDGISIGFSWNAPNPDVARIEALKSCLDLQSASVKARALCSVVTTFRHSCFSVAIDHAGGGGWGWAVEDSVQQAERKALESCKSTVQKSCLIAFAQCDVRP